ncbi:MAG: DNA/RNA non-specific endonuclease, partial [Chloroflexus sp.]|uniref:DNA/RNA non-specific endonuclease n=1 Tax=Chloroflexus sp. TaxID=1904827 RepID=UPI003D0DAA8C
DSAPARRPPAPARAADVAALLAQAAAQPAIVLPHREVLVARFGRRLDQIAVYAGPPAQAALALLHAEALTHQGAIFLADPHPPLELVAHEVVHVLQMKGGTRATGPQPAEAAIAGELAGWSEDGAVQHEAPIVPATAPAEREAITLAAQAQRVTDTLLTPPLAVTTTLPLAAVALRRATTPVPPTDEPAATFRRVAKREPVPTPPVQTVASPTPESQPALANLPPPAIEPDQPPFELPPPPAPGVSAADVAAQQAAQAQATAALTAAEGPEAFMAAFAAAPPTVKAQQAATLGSETDRLAKAEQTAFSARLPDLHAQLTTQVETSPPLAVVAPDARPLDLDVADAVPRVELPPTPDPGRYRANDRITADVSRLMSGEADDRAASLATHLRAVQTSDTNVATSPGAPPQVPLTGGADPVQLDQQISEGVAQSRQMRDEAAQAVINGPGPEQAQPIALAEAYPVGELAQPEIAAPAMPAEPQAYLEMGLPPEVQTAFDQQQQAAMAASLAEARIKVDEASVERDQQRAEAVAEAQVQAQEQSARADEQQRTGVIEARAQIQDARQETLAAQRDAVADIEQQATTERTSRRRAIDDRVRADEVQIEQHYEAAERNARAEVTNGERQAEAERQRSERAATEQSWWDRAVNFVRDAFAALTSAIGAIFDAVRSAVNAILDAAKVLAMRIIDAAAAFVNGLIAAFGELLKGLVDTLIGSIFPELAARLNAAIDSAVAFAQRVVTAAAEGLKASIAALVEGLRAGLNAIINVYQAAINAALSIAQAVLTGDWAALARMALEAVLKVAGIDPATFYQFIGRAQETFQLILDDPGGFVGHLVDAFLNGVRRFADNFLAHLQAGIIGWLTGALGGARITLPERFDLMGVLSLIQQILGLAWERLRERAVRLIGERAVAVIEFVASYLRTLIDGGWDALWQRIRDDLGSLRDLVLDSIKSFLLERIVMVAITRLATMFNPVGAIVNLILAAYNLFTFLHDQLARIIEVVQTMVNAISDIAHGIIQPAAQRVEEVLARLLPLAIDLLARLLGLGNVGAKVREIIERVRGVVDRALDRLIDRVRNMFRGGGTERRAAAETEPVREAGALAVPFTAAGQHHLYVRIVNRRAVMSVASDEQDFDRFADDLAQRIQALPDSPNKTHLSQQLVQARQLSTAVETQQTQAAIRAAQAQNVSGTGLPTEQNIQRQLDQLIAVLSGVMVWASSVPRDFTPGHIQYNPQGDRARRAHGWLGQKVHRAPEDQARVSEPLNRAITDLQAQGVTINARFDAGHLIASRYGGDGSWRNLVPMETRMNRSWFSAFEARVQTHVDAGEAIYADINASYGGDAFARLLSETEINSLTPLQQLTVVPVFERIPQAIIATVGRRTSDGRDRVIFQQTFDPRHRLAFTIGQARREGLVDGERPERSRDLFPRRDEESFRG